MVRAALHRGRRERLECKREIHEPTLDEIGPEYLRRKDRKREREQKRERYDERLAEVGGEHVGEYLLEIVSEAAPFPYGVRDDGEAVIQENEV